VKNKVKYKRLNKGKDRDFYTGEKNNKNNKITRIIKTEVGVKPSTFHEVGVKPSTF
jgi:hypothetical protein